jgi:hypothetical protein
MLSQFTYFSPPQEANTCVNCALIPTYLHIALIILDNFPRVAAEHLVEKHLVKRIEFRYARRK